MNVLPPKETFELAARELGTSAAFVEKDWHITQALRVISQIQPSLYKLVFTGGTALFKAHQLIQRFSEDLDFIVIPTNEKQNRKSRSQLKHHIIDALQNADFKIADDQIKSGNRKLPRQADSSEVEFFVSNECL